MSDREENFTPQLTADGSFTFVSHEFGESFHSHFGAKQESFLKFVAPTQLATSAHKPILRLLDICYGLGYNTAAALQTIWAVNPSCYVELIGLELNPSVPQAAIAHHLFDNWNYEYTAILTQLAVEHQVQTDCLKARLIIGDARNSIGLLHKSGFQADAIFLDPFSPPQCPHLWTVEFLQQVSQCLHLNGILATYSCAAAVRTALLAAGLYIGSTSPVGRKSPGTVAAHPRDVEAGEEKLISISSSFLHHLLPPLSQKEKEHLLTRAAIPYRDPQLNAPADVIVMRRQQEQQASSLEPTSHWRKRWLSSNENTDC
ncbi:tRNA (5-methylaminomethyl-2-thiouridine)(34)-methyltransferase MnmD [Nostocaceae cyanobacterium CENA369]|uniref:tRNA (5-methylaminomethyl-2-thiouridine)(34)-methyltransferase MnmD n=1 Tax=Dendronalium phyllosphericum CENA369 TaxID=1725256 RepID=A0A8J7I185_9NOST|nr:MnmC family methyltransferase [Dendronalium phyllosphericum]MBH8574110.1 tRNA (5-methylaminomethyl-2-thiouridine)(34)-methyltransferase MnmD [Dendronalium phyllosphericum CENA369]